MVSGAAQKGKHGVDETNSVAEEHELDQFFKSLLPWRGYILDRVMAVQGGRDMQHQGL